MHLSPHEQERLLVHVAADVARSRRQRGHRLNHPEAVAILTSWVFEAARDGRSVADTMGAGRAVLTADDVLDGVGDLIEELQVEATFPDGTKLVTLHHPIGPGSRTDTASIAPGEVLVSGEPIVLFEGRNLTELDVVNDGDRPVQVGSHFHFAEANEALRFDRAAATGRRLAVPAGTSVRFEPGIATSVVLVDLAGAQVAAGFRGLHGGVVTPGGRIVTDRTITMDRARYAALYGPTVGDRVRLADTDLLIRIEADLCGGPGRAGDEAVFGGGKVIRESMGQSGRTSAAGAPDLVITGAIVLDHWGIVKADVGVRDGRIVALGKAGNPDTMDGVHPALVIGPGTEIIAGNGKILTAGAIDSHVHLICPQIMDTALASGITTIVGGGTGPAEGTKATTVTGAPWYLHRMLTSLDAWPINVALLGKGNTVSKEAMHEQLRAGASGFKLHEDWGSTPAAISACLDVCDEAGVQAALHTDTLNEAGFVESTLAAIAGRSIHAYHTEGAGGGHAPDIITIASQAHVLPSSTNPTRPHTVNTVDEHLDMLMVCHHLNPSVPEDLAFAESRIRPSTIAAEDVLHDLGAIAMIGSDSQAMGRVGEVVIRTWQTAHAMKRRRGPLDDDGDLAGDNARTKRYVAKYTICPAIAHGLDDQVGSVEVGKLADLVLYDPRFFGVRPHLVVKGGMIAMAQMGDANASIPTPQPVMARPMFGAMGATAGQTSIAWVAPAAIEDGLADRLGLVRELVPVKDCRAVDKAQMVNNTACPDIRVDPDSFEVSIDGDVIEQSPVAELPMAQRYFLF